MAMPPWPAGQGGSPPPGPGSPSKLRLEVDAERSPGRACPGSWPENRASSGGLALILQSRRRWCVASRPLSAAGPLTALALPRTASVHMPGATHAGPVSAWPTDVSIRPLVRPVTRYRQVSRMGVPQWGPCVLVEAQWRPRARRPQRGHQVRHGATQIGATWPGWCPTRRRGRCRPRRSRPPCEGAGPRRWPGRRPRRRAPRASPLGAWRRPLGGRPERLSAHQGRRGPRSSASMDILHTVAALHLTGQQMVEPRYSIVGPIPPLRCQCGR